MNACGSRVFAQRTSEMSSSSSSAVGPLRITHAIPTPQLTRGLVVKAQYGGQSRGTGTDTRKSYGKSAQDDTSSAGLRRRALARLQGLLPAQWGSTPEPPNKSTGLQRQMNQESEPQEPYGLSTFNNNSGPRGLAQRTMITIRFQVHYQTYLGQELLIGGSHPSLGSWDSDRAIPMVWTPGDIWMVEVELPAGAVCFYKYLLAEGNRLEWQRGANHVLALPTEEHHVADRVYEATDLWSGEPTASSSAWQELLVRRIEEADELRRVAEQDANKSRAMAEAALTELIQAREDASAAWDLLKERGWLPAPEDQALPPGGSDW